MPMGGGERWPRPASASRRSSPTRSPGGSGSNRSRRSWPGREGGEMSDRSLDSLIGSLAQEPPFRFVDRLHSVERQRRAEGSVVFPPGHPIFEGHLPGEPLVPGVIVIEALAQLAGLALHGPNGEKVRGYLAEVGQTRFYR